MGLKDSDTQTYQISLERERERNASAVWPPLESRAARRRDANRTTRHVGEYRLKKRCLTCVGETDGEEGFNPQAAGETEKEKEKKTS